MYGGLIYGADGLPLKGADGGLVFSDAIAPSATHLLTNSGALPSTINYPITSPDETNWDAVVADIWADLRSASTFSASSDLVEMQARLELVTGMYYATVRFYASRATFTLPAGVRGNLTRMQARIIASASLTNIANAFTTANMALRFNLSESATAFPTGADLLDAAADVSETFAVVNAATHDNAQGSIEYRVDLPVDGINDYDSDTFYLWTALVPDPIFPYPAYVFPVPSVKQFYASAKVSGMKIGLET